MTRLSRDEREKIWDSAGFRNVLDASKPDMVVWDALRYHVGTDRAENISRKNFDNLVTECVSVATTRLKLESRKKW